MAARSYQAGQGFKTETGRHSFQGEGGYTTDPLASGVVMDGASRFAAAVGAGSVTVHPAGVGAGAFTAAVASGAGWFPVEGEGAGTLAAMAGSGQAWFNRAYGGGWAYLPALKKTSYPYQTPHKLFGGGAATITGGGVGEGRFSAAFGQGAGFVEVMGGGGAVLGAMFNAYIAGAGHLKLRMDLLGSGAGGVSRYTVDLVDLTRRPSTLVTLKLDYCTRSFGTAPCYGAGAPCYNTWHTCKYKSAYVKGVKEYKFCLADVPVNFSGREVRPYLSGEKYHALEIDTKNSVIINSRADLTFLDEPDADYSQDPYRVSAALRQAPTGSESAEAAGTYWRRLVRRNRNYIGREVEIRQGFARSDVTEADHKLIFRGVLDDISFGNRGVVQLKVKGLLQLTDVELPARTGGRLHMTVAAGATQFNLAPWSGVDTSLVDPASVYPESGYLYLEGCIVSYASRTLDVATGVTTFTGVEWDKLNEYGYDLAAEKEYDTKVQLVSYLCGSPIDLIRALLIEAGIAENYINGYSFSQVKDNYFQGVTFAGVIHEPMKIKDLLVELRTQTQTNIWQDENQMVSIGYVAPISPGADYKLITDEANIIFRSTNTASGEAYRVTRAAVLYDKRPDSDDFKDYRRVTEYRDGNAEHVIEYGAPKANKPIGSRWIWNRLGGDEYSRRLGARIVHNYRDGLPEITVDIEIKDSDLELGEIFEVESARIVDDAGNPRRARYLVVKKERTSRGKWRIKAVDTRLEGRWLYIAPDSSPSWWADGTDAEQQYGCISTENGYAPDSAEGYKIF